MKIDKFWELFGPVLQKAADDAGTTMCLIHAALTDWSSTTEGTFTNNKTCIVFVEERELAVRNDPGSDVDNYEGSDLYLQYKELIAGQPDRPQFVDFRNQLWTAMWSFPSVCEPRSRIIVPQFFCFLE